MKILIIKKKALVIGSVLLVCLLVAIIFGSGVTATAMAKTRKIPIYSVETSEKKVAISFDACWGADKTERILSALESYDVVGNYFCVSSWVEKYPDKVKMLALSNRIEFGTHSVTHSHMSRLTPTRIGKELDDSVEIIEKAVGKKISLFRAPYGEYNDSVIAECEKRNLYAIQWDVDSLDWKGLSASQIATRVLKGAKSGSIILMHNDGEHTVEALPLIILGLKEQGYTFSFISDLIYKDNYYIDSSGKQIRKP